MRLVAASGFIRVPLLCCNASACPANRQPIVQSTQWVATNGTSFHTLIATWFNKLRRKRLGRRRIRPVAFAPERGTGSGFAAEEDVDEWRESGLGSPTIQAIPQPTTQLRFSQKLLQTPAMARTRPSTSAPPTLPEAMTVDDLAACNSVSKSSICKLAQEGRVPGPKVGMHWRFHKAEVVRDGRQDQQPQTRPPPFTHGLRHTHAAALR